MKKFIKENWFKVSLLIILVISIVGAFYWFEVKPSEIRKKCANSSGLDTAPYSLTITEAQSWHWSVYKFCLADNGLSE